MSGTWPDTPRPAQVRVRSVAPTFFSEAHSFRAHVRSRGAHRFAVDLSYRGLTRAEAAPMRALLLAQEGRLGTFELLVPGHDTPLGAGGGVPQVVGAIAAGQSSVPVDGAPASTSAWLRAGDVVQFAGHSKVYMLTADADTDGSGAATLAFQPGLRSALVDDEAVTITGVLFRVRLAGDAGDWDVRRGYRSDLEITMVEAL